MATAAKRIELLNIPEYRQGTHDGLCVYYSCAMLLATLHPEFQPHFGIGDRRRRAGLVVEDPLIKYCRDPVNTNSDKAIASWFFGGADMEATHKLLNRIMRKEGHRTRFGHVQKNRNENTFDEIARSIDIGLPVIIAWDTIDFGNHAVVVRGYDISEHHHWFLLRDPGGDERMSWEVLKASMRSRLDVISVHPDKHDGLRPDRLVGEGGDQRLERWWFKNGEPGYRNVNELFEASRARRGSQEDDEDDDES